MESNEKIKEPSIDRFWHQMYIESQADPTDHRTDKQFCEDAVLDYYAFCSWKKKYRPFIFREVEALRRNYRNEQRSRIYKALDKKLDTDTNAIKLLAQLLGDLVEKTEVKTENMDDADKIRRLKALSQENTKKQKQWESSESGPAQPQDVSGSKESGGTEPSPAN